MKHRSFWSILILACFLTGLMGCKPDPVIPEPAPAGVNFSDYCTIAATEKGFEVTEIGNKVLTSSGNFTLYIDGGYVWTLNSNTEVSSLLPYVYVKPGKSYKFTIEKGDEALPDYITLTAKGGSGELEFDFEGGTFSYDFVTNKLSLSKPIAVTYQDAQDSDRNYAFIAKKGTFDICGFATTYSLSDYSTEFDFTFDKPIKEFEYDVYLAVLNNDSWVTVGKFFLGTIVYPLCKHSYQVDGATYTFNTNKTGLKNNDSFTWILSDDYVEVTFANNSKEYLKYNLEADILSKSQSSEVVATVKIGGIDFSIYRYICNDYCSFSIRNIYNNLNNYECTWEFNNKVYGYSNISIDYKDYAPGTYMLTYTIKDLSSGTPVYYGDTVYVTIPENY